ncbi:hypothetical protein PT974_10603 [Cladobotryum mycophilum]|uniref:Uncharacterized protein n=1 Tax=Cladobotryum mycophilum TaxID=491253 RepID=A0ABR0SBE3_9HYPO
MPRTNASNQPRDSLGIITTSNRFQMFGNYLYRTLLGTEFKCLSRNSAATHLMLPDFDLPVPGTANFCVAPACPASPISSLPRILTESREGISHRSRVCYCSVALSQNLKQLWLFHRVAIEGAPSGERHCTGMIIEYKDGSLASVGVCRRGSDIVVQQVESPVAIYYRANGYNGGMIVDCVKDLPIDLSTEWESWVVVSLESPSEIRWWFNDMGTVRILLRPLQQSA